MARFVERKSDFADAVIRMVKHMKNILYGNLLHLTSIHWNSVSWIITDGRLCILYEFIRTRLQIEALTIRFQFPILLNQMELWNVSIVGSSIWQ